jgi:hypothetical protein
MASGGVDGFCAPAAYAPPHLALSGERNGVDAVCVTANICKNFT